MWPGSQGADDVAAAPAGLVTVAVLIVAAALLFTGRYPAGPCDRSWASRAG